MPYFTWGGSVNAGSWFVIVAKDPEFHNIVDYAWTQVRAYAPRAGDQPITYPDETTSYYWAVLPAAGPDGRTAVGDPLSASPAKFDKQSTPPRLVSPAPAAAASTPPVFTWTAVEGARRYNLQVSREDDFGNLLDNVTTASITYTANTSYPADVALYWRVRAEDEKGVGLTWSEKSVFRYKLPAPNTAGGERVGDFIPTWRWRPIQGAVTYDMHVALPDGSQKDFRGIRSSALTATKMTGTGVFRWRVRANFPKGSYGTVPGPWSRTMPFTRTLGRPAGARTVGGGKSVHFAWQPKAGATEYLVQVSERPDFGRISDRETTDATTYAPELRQRFSARRPERSLALLARRGRRRGPQRERLHEAEAVPRRLDDRRCGRGESPPTRVTHERCRRRDRALQGGRLRQVPDMTTLRDDGMRLALAGLSSVEEIRRVTGIRLI